MPAELDRLRDNPVFAKTPEALLVRLSRESTLRRYERGDRVLTEGDHADRIFALFTGAVRVFHSSPAGFEVLLKLFRAPALFGEMEAFAANAYVENVEAVEPTEVLVMPVAAVVAVLREHADSAMALLFDVSARLRISALNEKSLAFDPVKTRLASYLLDYALWTNDANARELTLRLTQDEMAAALGVTRRAIAKEMTRWQKRKILSRQGSHYIVRDIEGLRGDADDEHRGLTYSLRPRS